MAHEERKSESVREAIRTELAKDEPAQSRDARGELTSRNGTSPVLQLDGVSLAFDTPVLDNVSFVANEGETVVIVGESGTGKSTILKLILRLLVPDKGHVCIDGQDITKVTQKSHPVMNRNTTSTT